MDRHVEMNVAHPKEVFVSMKNRGFVFDIQHFSTHDGPGIRTTVFLKGCPLRCAWCHNPESQSFAGEVLYHRTKCLGCGRCGGDHHGNADVCPSGAMELCGRWYTADEVLAEVLKDAAYYRHSGGGMTLSGGEPAAQSDFASELLRMAHERGIHTAVETSGCGQADDYTKKLLPYTDMFFWDIKLMDENLYHKYTGGHLDRVLANLSLLCERGAHVVMRLLFIPDIHLQPSVLERTRDLCRKYAKLEKEVVPYHPLGNAKREALGLPKVFFREPDKEEREQFDRALGLR